MADVPFLWQNATLEPFSIFNSKDTLQGSSLQVCPAHITGPRAKVRAGRRRVFPCTPFSAVVEGHYCRQVIGARHDRPAYGLGPGLPRPRGPGLKALEALYSEARAGQAEGQCDNKKYTQ